MTRRTGADGTGPSEPAGGALRPTVMTMRRPLRPVALTLLLLLSGCGERAASQPGPPSSSSEPAAASGLVLRVDHIGGFVPPSAAAGRLPLVAVYADGQVITGGPVPAVHPGP